MSDSTEQPLHEDVIDEAVVNQWFDYFDETYLAKRHVIKQDFLKRMRAACIAGVRKGKRNKAAVDAAVAQRLEEMARAIREPG